MTARTVQTESNQARLNCRGAARSRKFICKSTQKSPFFVILHPYLTKVDSRHDSTNHVSMLVLAAPGIRIV